MIYPPDEKERVRSLHPLEQYLPARGTELKKAGAELQGLCPFHRDKNPSLYVNPTKQLWTCRAGCGGGDLFAFVEKLDGLGFADAMEKLGANREEDYTTTPRRTSPPAPSQPTQKPTIAATYSYTDAKGNELFQALRLEPKSFRQRRKGPDGKWVWNLEGIEPVLYRLPDVLESSFVWVVEGEKDAESIARFHMCATCNPMGAGKWKQQYTDALAGKVVILCGDNDEPGEKHMDAVEKALAPVAKCTKRIRVPKGKDVTEFMSLCVSEEAGMLALCDLADAAPELYNGTEVPLQSMEELERDYREFVRKSDKRALHLSTWLPRLGKLRPVVPGELVFILANTGAGKTAALQNIAASVPHLPTLLFELELPGTLTFERFAAMASETDSREVWKTYKAEGEATVNWRNSGRLNHVHVCSKSGINVSDIERIVHQAHAKIGAAPALVLVDYIGLLQAEGRSKYERTSNVAEELKVMAKRTNTVVVCASQVSRDKDDPHAEVTIFSGKDSGSIENSSGLLFGLWRDAKLAGRTYLRVLKSTKGGAGLLTHIDFDGPTLRMTQAEDQPVNGDHPEVKPKQTYTTRAATSEDFPYIQNVNEL